MAVSTVIPVSIQESALLGSCQKSSNLPRASVSSPDGDNGRLVGFREWPGRPLTLNALNAEAGHHSWQTLSSKRPLAFQMLRGVWEGGVGRVGPGPGGSGAPHLPAPGASAARLPSWNASTCQAEVGRVTSPSKNPGAGYPGRLPVDRPRCPCTAGAQGGKSWRPCAVPRLGLTQFLSHP